MKRALEVDPLAAKAKQDALHDQVYRRFMEGYSMLPNMMRDPDSFKMIEAFGFSSDGTVCYTFRARNGFNGYNASFAVLAPRSKREVIGSDALWNKYCANRTGYEKFYP